MKMLSELEASNSVICPYCSGIIDLTTQEWRLALLKPFCGALKTPAENQVVLESRLAPPAAIASVTRIKANLASTARQFLRQSLTSRNAGALCGVAAP
jgi:hypothetical protein